MKYDNYWQRFYDWDNDELDNTNPPTQINPPVDL